MLQVPAAQQVTLDSVAPDRPQPLSVRKQRGLRVPIAVGGGDRLTERMSFTCQHAGLTTAIFRGASGLPSSPAGLAAIPGDFPQRENAHNLSSPQLGGTLRTQRDCLSHTGSLGYMYPPEASVPTSLDTQPLPLTPGSRPRTLGLAQCRGWEPQSADPEQ